MPVSRSCNDETACGFAVPVFQLVRQKRLHAKMVRQRAQDILKKLPNQDDLLSLANRVHHFLHGFLAQLRLQDVVKIFFSQQV